MVAFRRYRGGHKRRCPERGSLSRGMVLVDSCRIGKADHFQPPACQNRRALIIMRRCLSAVMDGLVHLDDQSCCMAIKINDKRIYDFLFIDFDRICFQKAIPQLPLLGRHFAPELSCLQQQGVMSVFFHIIPKTTESGPHPTADGATFVTVSRLRRHPSQCLPSPPSQPNPTGVTWLPLRGHEQRPRPADETGSCEWRCAPIFARACMPVSKNG